MKMMKMIATKFTYTHGSFLIISHQNDNDEDGDNDHKKVHIHTCLLSDQIRQDEDDQDYDD